MPHSGFMWWCWGLNPGFCTCSANTLPAECLIKFKCQVSYLQVFVSLHGIFPYKCFAYCSKFIYFFINTFFCLFVSVYIGILPGCISVHHTCAEGGRGWGQISSTKIRKSCAVCHVNAGNRIWDP